MPHLELYGTTTSPYVRRCRIVAHELGVRVELVDTATDAGQAALRALTPIWKVPAARIVWPNRETVLFDSRVICGHLLREFGPGDLAPSPIDPEAHNILTVIDAALDALINVFYLNKDGVSPDSASYLAKQQARAASAMKWVNARIEDGWLTSTHRFGLPEIALFTAVDWMRFRDTYAVDDHGSIVRCVREHEERGSLRATDPR